MSSDPALSSSKNLPSIWRIPKAKETLQDCQDFGCACASNNGWIVALSDGATESYQAGIWAKTLVQQSTLGVLQSFNDFKSWLKNAQDTWKMQIEHESQQASAHWWEQIEPRPAAATFLTTEIIYDRNKKLITIRSFGIGDTCMFIIRDNKLQKSFPISEISQFSNRPQCLLSIESTKKYELSKYYDELDRNDIILFATDALAEWILNQYKNQLQSTNNLNKLLAINSERDLRIIIDEERAANRIKNDDVALIIFPIQHFCRSEEELSTSKATEIQIAEEKKLSNQSQKNNDDNDIDRSPKNNQVRTEKINSKKECIVTNNTTKKLVMKGIVQISCIKKFENQHIKQKKINNSIFGLLMIIIIAIIIISSYLSDLINSLQTINASNTSTNAAQKLKIEQQVNEIKKTVSIIEKKIIETNNTLNIIKKRKINVENQCQNQPENYYQNYYKLTQWMQLHNKYKQKVPWSIYLSTKTTYHDNITNDRITRQPLHSEQINPVNNPAPIGQPKEPPTKTSTKKNEHKHNSSSVRKK